MKELFLINGIISFLIFLELSLAFFKNYHNERTHDIANYLGILGFFYAFLSVLSGFWFFFVLEFSINDFLLLNVIILFVQTLIFLFVVRRFTLNNFWNYIAGGSVIVVPLIISLGFYALELIMILLFLLHVLVFIGFMKNQNHYKKSCYYFIFYSILGAVFSVFILFGVGNIYVFTAFENCLLLAAIYLFIKSLQKYPPPRSYKFHKHYFVSLVRYFVFIAVLTNLLFLSTIVMHEFGHFAIGKVFGCGSKSIVYEIGLPHTQMVCKSDSAGHFALIGGSLLPFFAFVFLFIIGGKFMRDISFLFLGFGLLVSYQDLLDIGFSRNLSFGLSLLGLVFATIGVIMLAKTRVEDFPHLF
jgi:hypothetical protein